MQNPELLLNSFNNKVNNLLSKSIILNKPKLGKKLKIFFRQTFISELLFDEYVIAISGLQGAGKSTLVKELYELDDDDFPLPQNYARGEKLPVMIKEKKGISAPEMWIRKFYEVDKSYTIKKTQIVSKTEFMNIATDPEVDHLILEYHIPLNKNVLNTEDVSFILLPGLEESKPENKIWQELTNHTLTSAATCVFVLDKQQFADGFNSQQLKNIITNFGASKPIFILSKSDDAGSEIDAGKFKKDFLEKYNLPDDESDRVISTAIKSSGVCEGWHEILINAIGKYRSIQKVSRKSQIDNLYKLLDENFSLILTEFDTEQMKIQIPDDSKSRIVKKYFDIIETEIKNIRKKYKKKLIDGFKAYLKNVDDEIEKYIKDRSNWEKFVKLFTGPSLKSNREFREKIIESWNTANGFSAKDQQLALVNDLLDSEYPILLTPNKDPKITYKKLLLGDGYNKKYSNTDHEFISDDNLSDFKYIFSKQNENKEASDHFQKSLEVLPLITFEFQRILSIFPEFMDINRKEMKPEDSINEIVNNFKFLKESKGQVIKGMAYMLGLDYLPDGEIDTISGLMGGIGLGAKATEYAAGSIIQGGMEITSGTAMLAGGNILEAGQVVPAGVTATAGKEGVVASAAINPWVAGGVAVIALGFIASSVMKQFNKMDIQDKYYATQVVTQIKENTIQQYLGSFDSLMEKMVRTVKNRLDDNYNIPANLARTERLLKAYSDAGNASYELRTALQNFSLPI